jgi:hypothetical protein
MDAVLIILLQKLINREAIVLLIHQLQEDVQVQFMDAVQITLLQKIKMVAIVLQQEDVLERSMDVVLIILLLKQIKPEAIVLLQ